MNTCGMDRHTDIKNFWQTFVELFAKYLSKDIFEIFIFHKLYVPADTTGHHLSKVLAFITIIFHMTSTSLLMNTFGTKSYSKMPKTFIKFVKHC